MPTRNRRALARAAIAGRWQRPRWKRAVVALDLLMLVLGGAVASLAGAAPDVRLPGVWAAAYALLVVAVLHWRGGYRPRLDAGAVDELGRLLVAAALAATSLITLRVLLDGTADAAGHTVRLFVFGTVYLGAGRAGLTWATRRLRKAGIGGTHTLVVGAGEVGSRLAKRLLERPELGLVPVGFLDKDPRVDPDVLPLLGASWDLERVLDEHEIGHVLVTFSTAPHHVQLDLCRRCWQHGVEVSVVPRLFEQVTHRLSVEHVGGIPLLRGSYVDPQAPLLRAKYALDRVAAAFALLVLSPLLGLLALLVRRSSPGPILFRQQRVGLDGRTFALLKFRTMAGEDPGIAGQSDADWLAAQLGAPVQAAEEPAAPPPDRTTPIGRWLRRTSLDELPQLLNILQGDMSFVGPRPERAAYVAELVDRVHRYGDRHRMRSGLTGWAQVQGLRGRSSLSDRVEWDNFYIENWTPWLDLKILALTVPAVLSREGAG